MTGTAQQGAFITFEGPDGSGKTTQIARLADWLRSNGVEPVLLRQPGSTGLGERIRATLLDSRAEGTIAPLTELGLMFSDRAQSIQEIIMPALASGKTVLCDRYTDSSEAYQGAGRGLGAERVLTLHRALCDNLQPQLTVLLLPDVEAALQRARARNQLHRETHGAEGEAFYRRVHTAYTAIAQREPDRVHTISDGDIETVAARVRTIVQQRFSVLMRGPAGV